MARERDDNAALIQRITFTPHKTSRLRGRCWPAFCNWQRALRRWKTEGGQWVMILSGAQSAIVSLNFFKQAAGPEVPDITAVAPYAALGALYFLLSAIWLTVGAYRRRPAAAI